MQNKMALYVLWLQTYSIVEFCKMNVDNKADATFVRHNM